MTLLNPPHIRPEFQRRHPGRRMTEEEFVDWIGEKTRAEWMDGEVIMMAPVSIGHDALGWWLRSLVNHFADYHQLGTVFGSEVMVRLPRQRQRRMPDVSFVASSRADIVLETHINGPPDLTMEIVSPDSIGRDWRDKYEAYRRAGVREYWIVDPISKRMEAHGLARGQKYRRIAESNAGIASIVLPGFRLEPQWVFAQPRPHILAIARKLGIP